MADLATVPWGDILGFLGWLAASALVASGRVTLDAGRTGLGVPPSWGERLAERVAAAVAARALSAPAAGAGS